MPIIDNDFCLVFHFIIFFSFIDNKRPSTGMHCEQSLCEQQIKCYHQHHISYLVQAFLHVFKLVADHVGQDGKKKKNYHHVVLCNLFLRGMIVPH